MLQERLQGIREEIAESESLAELKALWCFGNEYGDAEFVPDFKGAVARLRNQAPQVAEYVPTADVSTEPARPNPPVQGVRRGNTYRLLDTNVSWSTKPQVHALMAIIQAHVPVGGEIDEADVVAACEANVRVLETRQGGRRIWDYYKGNHVEGLSAHGNVKKV